MLSRSPESSRYRRPQSPSWPGASPNPGGSSRSSRARARWARRRWSRRPSRTAFGTTLDEFVFFESYPGAAPLIGDEARWRRHILDALVETTISRAVLLLTRVDKPALLRRLFELGCRYSGQEPSDTKMLGQLHDAGNTTTLAHDLGLLAGAGLLTGLPKCTGNAVRRRASSPKLQVLNTALATALSGRSSPRPVRCRGLGAPG